MPTNRCAVGKQVVKAEGGNILIIDCKGCGGGATLCDARCLSGVLRVFVRDYPVSAVILAGYTEKKYSTNTITILENLRKIIILLEQLAKKRECSDDKCLRCEVNPGIMFYKLRIALLRDIGTFYKQFVHYLQKVDRKKDVDCTECLLRSGSDLIYLHNMLGTLRIKIALGAD